MKQYKETSKMIFNAQAKDYDTAYYGEHARRLYGSMLQEIHQIPFHRLLDVGCGTGKLLDMLQKEDPKKEYMGIDLSENMLQVAASQTAKEVQLQLGDAEHLPYLNHAIDVITCCDSFHHYPHPLKALKEMQRVLRPGGALILGDAAQPIIAREIMNYFLRFSKSGDVKIYSKKEMIRLLQQSGFQDIRYQKINLTSFIAVARRI